MRRVLRDSGLGLAALAAAVSMGCGDKSEQPQRAAGGRRATQFPVEVAPVASRDVDYKIEAVGSVEAFEIVQVTARVQGVVEAVRFAEGDRVDRGRTLVEIEPQRYRLAVASARAAAEKAEAARAEAHAGVTRREDANAKNPGIIPSEEIETWRTRERTATAELAHTRAALEQAELDLRDAFVSAPVGGTIQTRSVQTGEYVEHGRSLATLLRRDPLLLRFSVPEQDAGQLAPGAIATFRVRESSQVYTAKITHVAAAADAASRMVPVTAHVETTPDRAPRPGAFAEVTVAVGSRRGAPIVPETAVRPSERGFLAYVIQNGKAQERVLKLGMRTADGGIEVREGLAPMESLVVRGSEALRQGAAVRVVPSGEATALGTPDTNGANPAGGATATGR